MEPTALISASEITLFRECQRKWAFQYLERVEIPQHPKAALGDEIEQHQLQPFILEGRNFDYTRPSGYMAEAAREFLPPSTCNIGLQKYFRLPSPTSNGKWAFHGKMDMWVPDSWLSPGIPLIGDFKTSSDIGRWAKSEKQLRQDPQCVLYAMDGMYETRKKEIDIYWLYIQTEGTRKVKPTYFRAHAEELLDVFHGLDTTAKELFEVASTAPKALDLEPNPEMCEAYGGCPHRSRCNLSPHQILDAHAAKARRRLPIQEETSMSSAMDMIAKLKAKKNGTVVPLPVPTDAPPTELPQWATAPVDPMQAKIDASRATRQMPDPVVKMEKPVTPSIGINPPESKLPPPPIEAAASAKRGRPAKTDATSVSTNDGQLSVTWGKETYQVAPYCPIEVGPFSITGKVEPHETLAQALTRLTVELATFAEVERKRKVQSASELIGTK